MRLALYQCEYPEAPVLLLDMGTHGLRIFGPKGSCHYLRDIEPSEIASWRKPIIQAVVARALREGASRDEGEQLLDKLFASTCLRETWMRGARHRRDR